MGTGKGAGMGSKGGGGYGWRRVRNAEGGVGGGEGMAEGMCDAEGAGAGGDRHGHWLGEHGSSDSVDGSGRDGEKFLFFLRK